MSQILIHYIEIIYLTGALWKV